MASNIAKAALAWAKKAYEKATDTSIWHWRNSVPTYQDLPANPTAGDIYTIEASGEEYYWTGTSWQYLGVQISIDNALSTTSENPVQNKVVTGAVNGLRGSVAREYSASSAYAVDDFCMHDGMSYRCTTAIPAPGEAWNASHWSQEPLSDTVEQMIDLESGVLATMLTGMTVVRDTTSTSKTFTPEGNTRYIYDELTSLTVSSLPASGIVDILFDSGSTATTLSLPQGVTVPVWFDPTDLETNTRYELNFADGNCLVSSWPIATS